MHIRTFTPDMKTPVPGKHRGLSAVMISFDRGDLPTQDMNALTKRWRGLPILLDRPMMVVALYLEPHGFMEEHSASSPILFLVTSGRGFVRVGGPDGETRSVGAGEAVLWPQGLDHTVWTQDEALAAIVIEGPEERDATGA